MIVSDKTYTDLSNLSEDQREIVIEAYQAWLDESGLDKKYVFEDDLLVKDGYKFCRILKYSGRAKVFVDETFTRGMTKVTFEEIEYDRMMNFCKPPQQDARIEYWHKTCHLVTQYAGASEVLRGFYEGSTGGDSYLKIIEEGLKLRSQKVESDRQWAEEIEKYLMINILTGWSEHFQNLGYDLIYDSLNKQWEVCSKTTNVKYFAMDEQEIDKLHCTLRELKNYYQ